MFGNLLFCEMLIKYCKNTTLQRLWLWPLCDLDLGYVEMWTKCFPSWLCVFHDLTCLKHFVLQTKVHWILQKCFSSKTVTLTLCCIYLTMRTIIAWTVLNRVNVTYFLFVNKGYWHYDQWFTVLPQCYLCSKMHPWQKILLTMIIFKPLWPWPLCDIVDDLDPG